MLASNTLYYILSNKYGQYNYIKSKFNIWKANAHPIKYDATESYYL